MRVCVIGAGAIGGLMGAKLALAGDDVSVIDMGPHLRAIRQNGLKLIWEDGSEQVAQVKAYEKCADAGEQDLVILGLKAHYLELVAKEMEPLMGPDTMIMTARNGIPWWYFHNHGGPHDGKQLESLDPDVGRGFGGLVGNDGKQLESLDPDGVLTKYIDGDRIIGCVVYPAAAVTEPGVIKHVEGDRFPIGELDGSESERVEKLKELLEGAGFRSRVLDDIRSEIWLKAWGNLSFNPISALTHATLVDIRQFPETRHLAQEMMAEAQIVAEKLGITFRHTIEKRINGAESVGAHKTSMPQDVEAGRSLETEALIGAVLELARLTETDCPHTFAIYSCVKPLNKVMVTRHAGVIVQSANEAAE